MCCMSDQIYKKIKIILYSLPLKMKNNTAASRTVMKNLLKVFLEFKEKEKKSKA